MLTTIEHIRNGGPRHSLSRVAALVAAPPASHFFCAQLHCRPRGRPAASSISHISRTSMTSCGFPGCAFIGVGFLVSAHREANHMGQRPFKCKHDGCDFSCFWRHNLKVHEARPHGAYACRSCSFTCAREKRLQQHSRKEHREFVCPFPLCGRMFQARNTFFRHRKKHT